MEMFHCVLIMNPLFSNFHTRLLLNMNVPTVMKRSVVIFIVTQSSGRIKQSLIGMNTKFSSLIFDFVARSPCPLFYLSIKNIAQKDDCVCVALNLLISC